MLPVAFGFLGSNPTKSVALPRDPNVAQLVPGSPDHRSMTCSPQPVMRLHILSCLSCYHSRLRRGEICGLCWDDINYETREIRITHNLIESSTYGVDGTPVTELVLKEPKSVTSRRTLTLSADLERAFLQRVKSEQRLDWFASPDPWPEEGVFTAKNGKPVQEILVEASGRFLKKRRLAACGCARFATHIRQHSQRSRSTNRTHLKPSVTHQ